MLLLNDYLEIDNMRVFVHRNENIEGIGTGQILRAELTDPLWSVEINSTISEFNTGRRIRAVLNDIDRPQSYFRVYDPIVQRAANDPTGTLLTNVTISAIDNGLVTFTGQPVGYQFRYGDAFHVISGGRHYYFEIAQDGTDMLRTTPSIPSSIDIGSACVFIQPQIRVQMSDLNTAAAQSASWKMGQFQIKAIQKL